MTWFSSEASLGDTGKESNPLGHLPLRGQRLLVGSWSPANKDTHHSLQGRHLTAVLSVLRRFAKSGSEGPLSQGVWSGEPTWVVFLGQLLQGSAALCCSQVIRRPSASEAGREEGLISMSVSLPKLKIMGN